MWHGKCVSKLFAASPRQAVTFPRSSQRMSKQFFHKFLLNDTFAPAERFNPKLALGTVGRNVPGALAGAISFS